MPIAYIVSDKDTVHTISQAPDYGAVPVDVSDDQLADMQRIQDEWQALQTVLATMLATYDANTQFMVDPIRSGKIGAA